MAQEALEWAKQRAASMKLEDIASRIGGIFIRAGEGEKMVLPCFDRQFSVTTDGVRDESGRELSATSKHLSISTWPRGETPTLPEK